jgi:hypothetical protein
MIYIVDKIEILVTILALVVISLLEAGFLMSVLIVVIGYVIARRVRSAVLSVISEKDSFQDQ